MLYVNYVAPQPDANTEERVRLQLKQLDSLLDIRWIPNAVFNERYQKLEGRYAIVCRWPSADKRYALIQSGELGDDPHDILGWYTEDVHNANSAAVAPDALERRVMELLASADNERTPWKQRMAQTVAKNAAVRQANKNELEAMIVDAAGYEFNRVKGSPIVSVSKDIT
jgi:hypothetical protein